MLIHPLYGTVMPHQGNAMAKRPKPSAKKQAAPRPESPLERLRGLALVEAAIAATAPDVPGDAVKIAKPVPMSPERIASVEQQAGVKLGPLFRRWLAHDEAWLAKRLHWEWSTGLPVGTVREVIAAHAGPFIEAYDLVLDRLPGRALQLDAGSDSMRFLYFAPDAGDVDPPVLYIDHDDTPVLGVAHRGFDAWIARETNAIAWNSTAGSTDAQAVSEKLLGQPGGLDMTEIMASRYGADDD
jgi:hypothetical protein